MGRDRDSNHEVSGRDSDRDRDFTQPRLDPAGPSGQGAEQRQTTLF